MKREKKRIIKRGIISLSILIVSFFLIHIFSHYTFKSSQLSLYDRHGNIIVGQKHEQYKTYSEIPKDLREIIVSIEDRRFWYHPGIDIYAITRAAKHNISQGSVQGASTIDQQVIKIDQQAYSRSWSQKVKEQRRATNLQFHYSKKEILTQYINTMPFSHGVVGRKSACQIFWGQSCETLSEQQILLTVASAQRGLSLYNDRDEVVERARMYLPETLEKSPLSPLPEEGEVSGQPSFVKEVSRNETEDLYLQSRDFHLQKKYLTPLTSAPLDPRVSQTLQDLTVKETKQNMTNKNIEINEGKKQSQSETFFDLGLYDDINNILATTKVQRSQYNIQECCIMIINGNGNIVSMNMCSDRKTDQYGKINACLTQRQTGSAIKPFLYTMAFERFGFTKDDMIVDEPVDFLLDDENVYAPKNFDLQYHGEVSYAYALGNSLNIPAIKTVSQVGVSDFLGFIKEQRDRLSPLSEKNNKDADNVGLSVALGTYEMSPFAFTQLWRFFLPQNTPSQYMQESQEVRDIMSDPANKTQSFGQDNFVSQPGREIKTGTSRKFIDGWICGISLKKNLSVCLWLGNMTNEPMAGASSQMGSYVWELVLQAIERR